MTRADKRLCLHMTSVPPCGVHQTHSHTDTHTKIPGKVLKVQKKRPRRYCIPNTLDTFIWHVAVIYFGVMYEESTTGTSYVSIKQHPTSVRQLEKADETEEGG